MPARFVAEAASTSTIAKKTMKSGSIEPSCLANTLNTFCHPANHCDNPVTVIARTAVFKKKRPSTWFELKDRGCRVGRVLSHVRILADLPGTQRLVRNRQCSSSCSHLALKVCRQKDDEPQTKGKKEHELKQCAAPIALSSRGLLTHECSPPQADKPAGSAADTRSQLWLQGCLLA